MAKPVVEGADKLRAKLLALPDAFSKLASAAIWTGAGEMVETAKRYVPVEEGDLRDSIERHWTGQEDRLGAQGQASASRQAVKGEFKLSATVTAGGTPQGSHAGWVEFGTAAGEGHAATPAQPFFFPAWRVIRRRVRNRINRAMREAVRQVAGR